MKVIILAAGYGTRLKKDIIKRWLLLRVFQYRKYFNRPKALLPIRGRPMVDHLLEKVLQIKELGLDDIYLVVNDKYYGYFFKWANKREQKFPEKNIINDGTKSNKNRLGAIRDIQLVIQQAKIEDDLLVIAGDTLFEFSLADLVRFFRQKSTAVITAYKEKPEAMPKRGAVYIDRNSRLIKFIEKEKDPQTDLAAPPIYIYPKEVLSLLVEYLAAGKNPDAPGNFIAWLYQRKPVYVYRFTGQRFDIGNLKDLRVAKKKFKA